MYRRLLGKEKPRPDPCRLRPEGEHRCHAARVTDSTCRDHGDRSHRIYDRRHERECCDLAPHVATSFPALSDDDVDPGRHHLPSLLGASDRVQHEAAGRVNPLDVRPWITPGERDDAQPSLEHLLESPMLIPFEHEVPSDRSARRVCGLSHSTRGISNPRKGEHAESAGIRDRSSELRYCRRADWRLNNRMLDAQQVGQRRTHFVNLSRNHVPLDLHDSWNRDPGLRSFGSSGHRD